MTQDEKGILVQLEQVRQLFNEVGSEDPRTVENYAWLVIKALHSNELENDSIRTRQYLADVMHLPLPRPSKVYSALLGAACKVAQRFADFRFGAFLRMWDIQHLRAEDYVQTSADDGKTYPSLANRVVKAYMHSLLLYPDGTLPEEQLQILRPVAKNMHYLRPRTMMVTKVAPVQMQRSTMHVARLIDAQGLEITFCPVANLKPHPLHAAKDARHYVNVGQLYDVLLRESKPRESTPGEEAKVSVEAAYQSPLGFGQAYPVAVGYVESYDAAHQYYHVFDGQSRHFVADAAQENFGRFGRPTIHVGDFVQFAPIIPQPRHPGEKVFKRAHIINTCVREEGPRAFGLREARVVQVDAARKFYRWELTDATHPIVEAGTTEPAFTSGFVSFDEEGRAAASAHPSPTTAPHIPAVGETLLLVVYLRRGKDKQKRPRVVAVFPKA